MNKLNLKKIKIIKGLPPKATKADRCALDTEFFKMDSKKMHRPHGDFASLACTMDGETVYIITDEKQIGEFMSLLDEGVHIWHHARFDIGQLRRYTDYPERDRIWDTMLIEQEMFSGWYNDFSLKDLARRWLNLYLEKEARSQFEEASEMTKEMFQYAAGDVVVTYKIYQAQREYIDKKTLNVWKNVDRGALWTVLKMDGILVDQTAWRTLACEQAKSAEEIALQYPDINLRSPAQVLKRLQKKHKKLQSTGEKVLDKLEDDEFAQDVLKFRKFSKAASTYGEKFLEDVEPDGRMYSDFKINGAATGRFSSAHPNLENIPKDARYRACFIAAPENILIDADWSSQEPRVAAFLSQDERLIEIFTSGKDPYIEIARLVFHKKITKKDPFRNERMKPTVLGACYGLTEHGMEKQYNIPQDEGKELLDAFFGYFQGLKKWIDEQQSGKDYVTTILGRRYWLNPYQDKSDRNAINSPVQGSAGDALKIAAYRFMQRVEEEFDTGWMHIKIVNLIHDEILVECAYPIKDDVAKLLREVMIEVAQEMHPGIPADVEIGFGRTWAEAHQ